MLSFILPLAAILFAVVTLIFTIISFFKERNSSRFGIGSTIFSAAVTLIGLLCINVPTPTIYPLNSEAKIYEGELKITIDTIKFPFLNTYYSLDGTNPEDGYIYNGMFTINESTTVVAKNKFLIWWSEPSKSTYKFENIPITYSGELDLLISNKLPSANELLEYAITIIIILAIIWNIIRNGLRNIRDRIRNFFDF